MNWLFQDGTATDRGAGHGHPEPGHLAVVGHDRTKQLVSTLVHQRWQERGKPFPVLHIHEGPVTFNVLIWLFLSCTLGRETNSISVVSVRIYSHLYGQP